MHHKIPWLLYVILCLSTYGTAISQQISQGIITIPKEPEPPATSDILSIAVPSAMVAYGIASIKSDSFQSFDCKARDTLIEKNYCINNSADNYIAILPAASAFILKASGVESKNKLSDMVIIYALSNVAQSALVFGAKHITKRERPDGSDCNSFPSAHTAIAFTAAEFLHQEYGYKSAWISAGGYAIASAVGASRILNNKHWISDVLAGAGIGILCTKGVYWVYPGLKKKLSNKSAKAQTLITPDYFNGSIGIKVSRAF